MNSPLVFRIAGLAAAITLLSHPSYAFAFDLSGGWTTNVSACTKIFRKNNKNELSIISGSGIYGDSFIVRKNSISSLSGTCTITTRKDAGQVHHLIATCAPGNVAISTFQFSYRVKDDNTIVRNFPGLKELDVTYARCKL